MPNNCAAGMVCSLHGLSFPDSFCPPGHFCSLGVSSPDPRSLTHARVPLECPENTWCAAGVASNVSIPGNHSTPQPCLAGFVCFRGSDNPQGSGPCPTGYFCPPGARHAFVARQLSCDCPHCACASALRSDARQARCRSSAREQTTVLVWAMSFHRSALPDFTMIRLAATSASNAPLDTYVTGCADKHVLARHVLALTPRLRVQAGLSFPVICPAGAVCNEPGLQVPATSCPPGYYCWEGTETADWNSEGSFKPIACPKAVYCLGGITNNLTNENDYLSPQPCTLGQYCKEASTSPFGTGPLP